MSMWRYMDRVERDLELDRLMRWAAREHGTTVQLLARSYYVAVCKLAVPVKLRGDGRASTVLGALTRWADRELVVLGLTPTTQYGADMARLLSLYNRAGFAPVQLAAGDVPTIGEALYRHPCVTRPQRQQKASGPRPAAR